VLRLKRREADAWGRLLELYGPLVYSWCRARWRLSPPDAADVVQDVMRTVLEAIDGFQGGNFLAWLAAITRSRAADHVRCNPTRAAGGEAQRLLADFPDPRGSPTEGPAEEGAGADLGGVLSRALERVRSRAAPTSWQAFWQVTLLGRAPDDVARDLGLTRNAVYVANSRILRRLREEVGEC
jgi:RNA polymerase sigma-70 factor (ECF subfamily)